MKVVGSSSLKNYLKHHIIIIWFVLKMPSSSYHARMHLNILKLQFKIRLWTFTFTKMVFLSQLADRPSSQDLIRVMYSIFQSGAPSSFSQLMSTVSDLFCGYTESEITRVFSFNWYEDNNYKSFLGIDSSRGHDSYTYDKTASESYIDLSVLLI